jgi:two-component SAPR family response regulator
MINSPLKDKEELKLTAIVVDDDEVWRNLIVILFSKYKRIEFVGNAQCYSTAKSEIQRLNLDVLFLDVNLWDSKNGFDLLKDLDRKPKTVFVSADTKYESKAFESGGVAFLKKSFSIEEMKLSVHKIMSKLR